MIIAFEAKNKLKDDAPAIVHIDGTSRVQIVYKEINPKYCLALFCRNKFIATTQKMATAKKL